MDSPPWSIGRNVVSVMNCPLLQFLYQRIMAGRIPSIASRLSIESWDFSQGAMISPSLTRSKRPLDDNVFEMDEAEEAALPTEESEFLASVPSHSPSLDTRPEISESPQGNSMEEVLSTPSTSLLSSTHQHSAHTPSTHTVTLAPAQPPAKLSSSPPDSHPTSVKLSSSPLDLLSSSPPTKTASSSSSHGLWRKLRGIGSKPSLNRQKRQESSDERESPPAIHEPKLRI